MKSGRLEALLGPILNDSFTHFDSQPWVILLPRAYTNWMAVALVKQGAVKTVEIYLSTDIEADGPIPGPHSMLSLASVAIRGDGTVLGEFSANLETLAGASMHPRMAAWWQTEAAAWHACRENLRAPEIVMADYLRWIQSLPGRPVFVAMPAGFDFLFVYWYFIQFLGASPFGHSALDMKSFAMALLGSEFRKAGKSAFPKAWQSTLPHTHIALDDAREQGESFIAMLKASRTPLAAATLVKI